MENIIPVTDQAQLKKKLDRAMALLLALTAASTLIIIRQITGPSMRSHNYSNVTAEMLWGVLAVVMVTTAVLTTRLILSSQRQFAVLFAEHEKALVSAQEQSEALRRMRQSLTAGLETVAQAVITADAGERITYMNPLAEKLTAWQAADAIGKPISKVFTIVDQKSRAPLAPPSTKALSECVPVHTDKNALLIGVSNLETLVQCSATPIWDEEHSVAGVTLTFQDSGKQNAATDALRSLEASYQTILETSLDGIITADANGVIVDLNPITARIFGRPRAKIQGTKAADLLVFPIAECSDFPDLMDALANAQSSGLDLPVEAVARRMDGTEIPILINMTLSRTNTGQMLTMCIQDMSEIGQLEAQLNFGGKATDGAERARSRFLANVSDEFRQPLNTLIGFSEIMIEDDEDLKPEQKADIKKIHDSGKHLLTLVNHMLNLSKIETDTTGLFLDTVDIAEVLQSISTTVRPMLENNNNRLQVYCADNVTTIYADRIKLMQSLINAVTTVCKFTTFRTITLVVARQAKQDRGWITFRIADAAASMTTKELAEFLESFPESTASSAKKSTDLGLALTVSKRLCKMMGGDLMVESHPGKGTMYVLRLPEDVQSLLAMQTPVK